MEFYTTHGEWDVISTKAERVETVFECCPDVVYPEVIFTLYLRRKALFYVMNVIVPSVFLSTLVLLVFYLPPGAGEKISLGVTLLLAFSVFVLMIADNVPNTSEAVPLISKSRVSFIVCLFYYVLVSVSPWKRTWYRQRDKVDFITLLFITFHLLIETMLDHVTVVFSYATAVVLNLKTQSVNIYSGFKG